MQRFISSSDERQVYGNHSDSKWREFVISARQMTNDVTNF